MTKQSRWGCFGLRPRNDRGQRALEKEVCRIKPELSVVERIKPVTKNLSQWTLGIDEEMEALLKRIGDLESQRLRKPASSLDVLKAMGRAYLKKHDPLEKAKRAKSVLPQLESIPVGRNIPARLKHALSLRDQRKCQIKSCENRRWLDVHHLRPISRGGTHSLDNLTTLCSAHHRIWHQGRSHPPVDRRTLAL